MTGTAYKQARFPIAVDCIIFGFSGEQLDILLIHRGFEPKKGQWSLMGGFVREAEDLDQAARRILKELTGLEDLFLEQIHTFGGRHRDPVERVISVAYFALIRKDAYQQTLLEKYRAQWFPAHDFPSLIFDHEDMVEMAKAQLVVHSKTRPLGFNLLPPKFTLPQLQLLYEAIYQMPLDKRNFRKKILSLGILKKLDEKERSQSKKGAYLYQFDEKAYGDLIDNLESAKDNFTIL